MDSVDHREEEEEAAVMAAGDVEVDEMMEVLAAEVLVELEVIMVLPLR